MKKQPSQTHRRAIVALLAIGGFVALVAVLQWGWNAFAVDILGQQAMQFKHALGFVLLLAAVGSSATLGRRHGRRGPRREG